MARQVSGDNENRSGPSFSNHCAKAPVAPADKAFGNRRRTSTFVRKRSMQKRAADQRSLTSVGLWGGQMNRSLSKPVASAMSVSSNKLSVVATMGAEGPIETGTKYSSNTRFAKERGPPPTKASKILRDRISRDRQSPARLRKRVISILTLASALPPDRTETGFIVTTLALVLKWIRIDLASE